MRIKPTKACPIESMDTGAELLGTFSAEITTLYMVKTDMLWKFSIETKIQFVFRYRLPNSYIY